MAAMLRDCLAIGFVGFLVGCSSQVGQHEHKPELWPARSAFVPSGTLVEQHPAALKRISRWGTHVAGPVDDRPDTGHRGAFGTGNGYAFGFVGETDPLNTLHSLTTPTYQRHTRFYGDYSIHLAPVGTSPPPDFDEEWAARSLSARVLLTRGVEGDMRLDTIDFAPHTDDPALRTCFLRVLTVTNDGSRKSGEYEIDVTPVQKTTSPGPGLMQETLDARNLTTGFTSGDASYDNGRLVRKVPPLDPGAEATTVLYHCGGNGTDVTQPPKLDVGALLDEEAASYHAWEKNLLSVDLPDPMVADLVDGMKMTLEVQTASSGASCPMSNYTGTWTRDNIGPALALLAFGDSERVGRQIDYLYAGAVSHGDLSNSYDADLDVSALPPVPDWSALPGLSGRVASETPSYVVWMYDAYYRSTGRLDRAKQRFPFLRRCLMAQAFGDDNLLPFTGDETYRTAMSVAFDLSLSYAYKTHDWSANSTLLWLGAEKRFVDLAGALGMDADAAAAEQQRTLVEDSFSRHYLLPDGCVAPFVDRDTGKTWTKPFEDVALKLTWAGAKDGDDPAARKATSCLLDRLRLEPGRVQSPAAERYQNFALLPPLQGVLTGMTQGYTLSALTSVGHPEAQDAFNLMARVASSSGNFDEYMIADDLSGLTLIYDSQGPLGDYTAKFRPWEGGIDVAAMLQYLTGFEPNEPDAKLSFRPHLPNHWPHMAFKGFRSGDARFDLDVTRDRSTVVVHISSHAKRAYQVALRWDARGKASASASVGGQATPATATTHFGQPSLVLPDQTLEAGATLEVRIDEK